MRSMLASAVLWLALCACAGPSAAATYLIEDLTVSPVGNLRTFTAVNSAGDSVGYYYAGGRDRGFVRIGGVVQPIGTLGGDISVPLGINSAGLVAGYSTLSGSSQPFHAFVWSSAGGMQDIGTLNGISAIARDLNNSGCVVGESGTAFIWDPAGGMRTLGTLPGYDWHSAALAINNAGTVLGSSTKMINPSMAIMETRYFLWDEIGGMRDLSSLIGVGGIYPQDINDFGSIAGYYQTTDSVTGSAVKHAFVWSSASGLLDLGTMGIPAANSYAYGINNLGQVVGSCDLPNGGSVPFIWGAGSGMQNPGTLGGISNGCADINDSGLIVGSSSSSQGFRAVHWTPVPEPSGVCVLITGMCGAASIFLSRRR